MVAEPIQQPAAWQQHVVGEVSLDEVMAYQHPAVVQRLQKKLGIEPRDAEQLFADTKRFLCLCAIADEPIAPTETLDFGWHEFILFTRDYADFCERHFGRFIHHRPKYPDDPPTNGGQGRRALAMAQEIFGDGLSENWQYSFPGEANFSCNDQCGCDAACNDD
ncbi:hypothetical protein L0Y40_02880 [Candidatus Wolfebacteria bacterium]|nr:hypothetical protein [Candidatus Wolfebacteria bacterium]